MRSFHKQLTVTQQKGQGEKDGEAGMAGEPESKSWRTESNLRSDQSGVF